MNQEFAQKLFQTGCFILLLNAPVQSEFGIDTSMFTTGPKFKGLKFVPPGLHYVSLSLPQSSFKQGVFLFLKERQVVVLVWDVQNEVLRFESEEQVSRIQSNIKEFDPFLGPYPLMNSTQTDLSAEYRKWQRLTSSISKSLLHQLIPSSFVSSMSSVSRFSDVDQIIPHSRDDVKEPNDDFRIHFTEINMKRSWPPGATGEMITKYSLDKSFLFKSLLETHFVHPFEAKDLIGEVQLAFVLFLIGQVYDGFEQWKLLVQLFCQSNEAVINTQYSDLFASFLNTLRYQLQECPADFFQDALSSNSFLRSCLLSLAESTRHDPLCLSKELRELLTSLFDFVAEQFDWDPRLGVVELDAEDEEDAPVVVEL